MAHDEVLRAARADAFGCFISIVDPEERKAGSGELGGIPFAVKDNLDTVDLPTTANTPGLVGSRPRADNRAITALERAGGRLVGKTNMHELALGITTNAAVHPATKNPADRTRSAGGSSGGSAAAVAAGIVPFALGTDTGGSITIPAAWCGVFGFRPSAGRWPGDRVVPLSPTRDTLGVIAESLDLVAQVDSIVCSARANLSSHQRGGLPIRLGVPHPESIHTAELSDDVRGVWVRTCAILAESPNFELVLVETDDLHRLEATCGAEIEFFEISHALAAYLGGLRVPMSFHELREGVARADVGRLLDESWRARGRQSQYRAALETRSRLQTLYDDVLSHAGLAAIIYPSVPVTATEIGVEACSISGVDQLDIFAVGTRNVNPGSVAGQPVVSVPAGRASNGLPVGVSIEGARFADQALIGIARTVTEALAETRS